MIYISHLHNFINKHITNYCHSRTSKLHPTPTGSILTKKNKNLVSLTYNTHFQSNYSRVKSFTTVPALVDASGAVTWLKLQTAPQLSPPTEKLMQMKNSPTIVLFYNQSSFPMWYVRVTQMLMVIEQGFKRKGKALFNQAAKQHWHGKFELNCC